mgnify:CR=1 FL=1
MNQQKMYGLIEQHYRDNYKRLVNGLSSKSNGRQLAEEIVQEAYTRALQYWSSYDPTAPFDNWFQTIISNCFSDTLREETMHGSTVETVEPLMDTPLTKAVIRNVEQLVDDSPEPFRTVYRLFFFKGYTPKEISQVTRFKPHHIAQLIYMFKKNVAK